MPATDNRRILVVDDNDPIHDDFKKILTAPALSELDDLEAAIFDTPVATAHHSFALSHAFQGADAVAMVQHAREAGAPYALAFVDMRMPPGIDGVVTIERLWKVDPSLQVVICSAYSDYSWAELRDRVGRTDSLLIVKKPFDKVEILQAAYALTEKWNLAARRPSSTS